MSIEFILEGGVGVLMFARLDPILDLKILIRKWVTTYHSGYYGF